MKGEVEVRVRVVFSVGFEKRYTQACLKQLQRHWADEERSDSACRCQSTPGEDSYADKA